MRTGSGMKAPMATEAADELRRLINQGRTDDRHNNRSGRRMKVQIKVHMSLNGRDNAAMRSWALKNALCCRLRHDPLRHPGHLQSEHTSKR